MLISNSSMNNKIIKNTIILYIKLIVTTVVGLYSSRFILKALGIDDYGLYVVIGGVVTIMNFLSTVMTTTSYRFITVELGKGDKGEPQLIYNTIRLIHIFLAIFLLLLGETIGVHYVNHYLNVEVDKIPDALYLLHWSVITSAVSLLAIPSTGLIIARDFLEVIFSYYSHILYGKPLEAICCYSIHLYKYCSYFYDPLL